MQMTLSSTSPSKFKPVGSVAVLNRGNGVDEGNGVDTGQ